MSTRSFYTSLSKLCLYLAAAGIVIAQNIPDHQARILEELDHIFVDIGGRNDALFASAITPCSNYRDVFGNVDNNTLGRQSSAQWIRAAFHDFATANIKAGTGGIDGSIAYELDRKENAGEALKDSLFFFSFFVSAKLSVADCIAAGAAIAIGACGGPYVPLRGGRIDATEAGPPGVCEPETDLKTALKSFEAAGFNQADTIALTACGHTMGGVRHATFPTIVDEGAVSADNLDGRETFDETTAVFDVKQVTEYLDGTGRKGGPLVTTANKTLQSDFRLFSSDNNQTMKRLGSSAEEFSSVCSKLIARMIDTVPRGVTLTPAIEPAILKLVDPTLTFNWKGDLTLSSLVRACAPLHSGMKDQRTDQQQYINKAGAPPAPTSIQVSLIGLYGNSNAKNQVEAKSDPATDVGTTIFGQSRYYNLSLDFPGGTGLSGISILNKRFPLQDSLFVAYTLSSISPGLAALGTNFITPIIWTLNITAAFRTTYPTPLSLTATFAIPILKPNILNPTIDTSKTLTLARIGAAGPFTIYSAVTTISATGASISASSVDIAGKNTKAKAEFFKIFSLFSNGVSK